MKLVKILIFTLLLCLFLIPLPLYAEDCEECTSSSLSVTLDIVKKTTYYYSSGGCCGSGDGFGVRTLTGNSIYSTCDALQLSDIVANVTGNAVSITWNTNKPVSCRLTYGAESGFDTGVKHTDAVYHSVILDRLLCEKYHFQIFAVDDCDWSNVQTDLLYFIVDCPITPSGSTVVPIEPTKEEPVEPTNEVLPPEDLTKDYYSIIILVAGVILVFVLIVLLIMYLMKRGRVQESK